MTEIHLPLAVGALALLFAALFFWLLQRRTPKKQPALLGHLAANDGTNATTTPDDAALINFESQLLSVFDFALFNAGYGHTRPWVMLRRAVKDIFLNLDDADTSPTQANARQVAHDLGKKYGLFVWAFDRHTPDDDNHLGAFVAAFVPQPWQGLLNAEPRMALDCYHALPVQTGMAFWVVAKAGILMAQRENDRVAEGLLWGALADMALLHYSAFGLEARNALDRLLDCGNEVLLVVPSGFSAFEGPLDKLSHLLRTLKGLPGLELHRFVAQLQQAYGQQFKARYGRELVAP